MTQKTDFDLAKEVLTNYPQTRNSDKKFLWRCWELLGFIVNGTLKYDDFMALPPSESLTRARRKVVEQYPHLDANREVKAMKNQKEKSKGTFIFREGVAVFVPEP